jgi:alkylhydroperoxidase family enzyme
MVIGTDLGIRAPSPQGTCSGHLHWRAMSDEIAELRRIAAAMPPAPEAMAPYLAKVRDHAYKVADEDVDALRAHGFAEDEIFEQTVAVAIAQGLRRYDAAMEAIG